MLMAEAKQRVACELMNFRDHNPDSGNHQLAGRLGADIIESSRLPLRTTYPWLPEICNESKTTVNCATQSDLLTLR